MVHQLTHISLRLKQVRDFFDYTQSDFAEKLGSKLRGYQQNEHGRNMPGGRILLALAEIGVNVNWVLTGQGSMMLNEIQDGSAAYEVNLEKISESSIWLKNVINENHSNVPICTREVFKSLLAQSTASGDPETSPYATLVRNAVVEITQYQQEYDLIAVYEVEASAGYGALVASEIQVGQVAFRKDWVKSKGLQVSQLAIITARGDSMLPTIADGDILLIDTRIQKIIDDSIYIIGIEGCSVVKRVQRNINDTLTIISDNAIYKEQVLTPDQSQQIRISGRVVWYGHEI